MSENKDKIEKLENKLSMLIKHYNAMGQELVDVRREINSLKQIPQQYSTAPTHKPAPPTQAMPPANEPVKPQEAQKAEAQPQPNTATVQPEPVPVNMPQPPSQSPFAYPPKKKSNIEKFIGENLINKIGIIITIIGVAIGVKYSIEHQLISPLVRIILGYLLGFGLLAFGIKLKEKYHSYSAVLVSGATAIMYFTTFAAYSFYELFPQMLTFLLMLVFTTFAVIAAIHYNKQIIAHIGLVGAYAVPFLLSDGSGKVLILFTYMAIINIGILFIAYKKYWKPLYYVAFGLTWVIFLSWYLISYNVGVHFSLALIFSSVFFLTFYAIFLTYKLIQKEQYTPFDIIPLLLNSFLFYGLGYAILSSHKAGNELLGLFTLVNGIIHFVVSVIIYKQKLADKKLLYLIIALVFVFITMAIPVQLDGNWVTLLWMIEAFLLFAIAQAKNISIYRNISYVLMGIAVFSLFQDWAWTYGTEDFQPVLNVHFLTSIIAVVAFAGINYFYKKYPVAQFASALNILLPACLIIIAYCTGLLEVQHFWSQLYDKSVIVTDGEYGYYVYNYALKDFKTVWIAGYTLLFAGGLTIFNCIKAKNFNFGVLTSIVTASSLFLFLTTGLYALSELRETYLDNVDTYYAITGYYIAIRYISFAFVAVALGTMYWQNRQAFMQSVSFHSRMFFDIVLHVTLIWIISSEVIHWLDMVGNTQTYKFGLSILWGIYALLLIGFGIWKQKKYFRIGGIALLGVTLLKLFFYDLAGLNTIAKTILFISLGILLLIVSFLYNKYKHLINDDSESKN